VSGIPSEPTPAPRTASLLERLTGVVLLAVLVCLGGMLVYAYRPDLPHPFGITAEVVTVLVLLTLALGLVSLVALLHTRS
jgi:hypothetical protein